MNTSGGDSVKIVIGLTIGNLAYLVFTLILSAIIGVAPVDIFSGPFSGTASSLVTAWVAIGGLLGAADLLTVLGFVSSLTGEW